MKINILKRRQVGFLEAFKEGGDRYGEKKKGKIHGLSNRMFSAARH